MVSQADKAQNTKPAMQDFNALF